MKQMTPAAVERAMKLQDVMLRAMAKRITWYQAAEILGLSGRQMLRWQTRFKHEGYEGLFDRRRGTPSPKRVPLATVETVLRLYQEQYFDFNVRHFHEKLGAEHGIQTELHLGEGSVAGSGTGEGAEASREAS
jgi:transposase